MERIKKNDTVLVISGKDKGKKGQVIAIDHQLNKVKVKGVAIITRHKRARRQGEQGGIFKEESFIHISNVMPLCPSTKKPCRVAYKKLDDGTRVRVSKRSDEQF